MNDQLKGLGTRFPFWCTLALIGVLSQKKFGYT